MTATDDDEAKREERQRIVATVERAIMDVDGHLSQLKSSEIDGEATAEIDELEQQLRLLNEQRERVQQAPGTQLATLKVEVGAGVAASRIAAEGAMARGQQQVTRHVVEMKSEEISGLMQKHDRDAGQFRNYEHQSASRIEKLAASRGIDISGFKDNRYRLLAERMKAEAAGDRAGVFRADALLGYNNVQGLEKAGASREAIEEAKRKADEAKERYLKERELQALDEGRKSGMSGDALKAHVESARSRAADELEHDRQTLRRTNGLSSTEIEDASRVSGHRRAEFAAARAASVGIEATKTLSPRERMMRTRYEQTMSAPSKRLRSSIRLQPSRQSKMPPKQLAKASKK